MSAPVCAASELPDVAHDSSYDDMVMVRDIAFDVLPLAPLESRVPFTGVAHIAYLPDGRTVAPSQLARIVDRCARRSHSQAHLAREITRRVEEAATPRGVGVVVTSTSPATALPGNGSTRGATAITTATTGVFRYDTAKRSEFLRLTGPVGARR